MPQTLGAHLAYGASFLLLLGAVLLTFGGISLVAYILRQGRDELKHRVAMVEPRGSSSGPTDLVPADVFRREPLLEIPGGLSIPARREIMRRMGALNVPANRALFVFTALRGVAVLLAVLLGYFASASMHALDDKPGIVLLIGLAFGIGGWFLPAMVVGRLVQKRTETVATGLPDALELLVVCVEAGLALEDGLERVVTEMRHSHPSLAEELALTAADLKILPSRDQALSNLADRVAVPSVRSVATTLSQTMRYGTPMVQALRTVASELRDDSVLALEERANRLPTLMTLPMMLFIMPTIFLIVGGPAALRLMDTFLR